MIVKLDIDKTDAHKVITYGEEFKVVDKNGKEIVSLHRDLGYLDVN